MSRTFFAAGLVGFSAHPIFQPAEHFLAFGLEADDLAIFVEAGPYIHEFGELFLIHFIHGDFLGGVAHPDPAGAMDGGHIVGLDALEVESQNHIDQRGLAGLDACPDFGNVIGHIVATAGILDGGETESRLAYDFGEFAVVSPAFAAVEGVVGAFMGGVVGVGKGDGGDSLFHGGLLLSFLSVIIIAHIGRFVKP